MVRANWSIVTLVTHSSGVSSSGVSRGIHHKCKICWIRPGYTYLDESSRVVVYRLKSHNMRGCCMDIGWWKYIWLYDENIVGSSLPCLFMVVLYVVLLSCDDHQFDWWEQMGEVLVVSKEMVIPLLNLLGWIYLIHDFFRAMTHVSLYAFLLYTLC